jgi:hypothetical protein
MGEARRRSRGSGSKRPSRGNEIKVRRFLRGEPESEPEPEVSETVDGDGGDDAVRHELEDFLEQDQAEIAAEYERIFRRSAEDPGTAGDEGEENWAALLRKWLPPSYQVVTKGRIIFPDGTATPQIDVLVLRGAYPPRLLDKKLYLSSGVVAAFECKNTLKARHITKAAKTAALLKSSTYLRCGTLLAELYSPPVYGLLAHSHSWKAESSTPIDNIDVKLAEVLNGIGHPSELIDIICVADLAAWTLTHWTECPWFYPDDFREFREKAGAPPEGSVTTGYFRYGGEDDEPPDDEPPSEAPNPVAVLVSELLKRLAWDDPDLLPLADYFRIAGIRSFGMLTPRFFGLDVLSEEVQERLRHQGPSTDPESFWDEWYGMLGGGS